MKRPGVRFRAWASRIFSSWTMARVIDPAVADLQVEHARASAAGQLWRARWIQVAGHITCLRTVALHLSQSAWLALTQPSPEDRRLARRVIVTSTLCLAIITVLFASIPMMWLFGRNAPSDIAWLTVTLVPQALPRAIPVALAVSIALAIGAQPVSRSVVAIVLTLALSAAALSFVTLGWAAPASNRAFREAAAWTGPHGEAEATLAGLARMVQMFDAMPRWRTQAPEAVARIELAYYGRFALPVAPLAIAAWLLARRRSRRGFAAASHAAMGCGLYFGLLTIASLAVNRGAMPALAAVWLPNLIFFAAAAALVVGRRQRIAGV